MCWKPKVSCLLFQLLHSSLLFWAPVSQWVCNPDWQAVIRTGFSFCLLLLFLRSSLTVFWACSWLWSNHSWLILNHFWGTSGMKWSQQHVRQSALTQDYLSGPPEYPIFVFVFPLVVPGIEPRFSHMPTKQALCCWNWRVEFSYLFITMLSGFNLGYPER